MPEQSDRPNPHGDPLEDVIDSNLEDTGDESQDDGNQAPPAGRRPDSTRIADIEN
jgi:hypothetical protein